MILIRRPVLDFKMLILILSRVSAVIWLNSRLCKVMIQWKLTVCVEAVESVGNKTLMIEVVG